ncbi:MAG: DNA-3-methyladenine glycosylase 2 family protein [Chitinophagia bacterium]|nr:DNA-3-methyladenine glycosylase 2 family protein [Chitinophagia bacterium]
MSRYVKHLKKDAILSNILVKKIEIPISNSSISVSLMNAVVSQQLNTQVAAIIWNRFLSLYAHQTPSCRQVLDTPIETLRSVGLSEAKANYIKSVAAFCIEQKKAIQEIDHLSDEEVIDLLTQIKGVGVWTVQMLLMFTLGRVDVFAPDDGGIQQAMAALYDLDKSDKRTLKKKMIEISENWKPYRTYACLHLWRWKDASS